MDQAEEPSPVPAWSSWPLPIAAVVAVSTLLVLVAGETPLIFVGWYGLTSVAGAMLVLRRGTGSRGPAIALGITLLLVAVVVVARAGGGVDPFQRDHDGGVLATEAASRLVLEGENPYTADLTSALQPHHHTLEPVDGEGPNPLTQHFPYLPAAFLVHLPLLVAGPLFDPRVLYTLITAIALVAVGSTGAASATRRTAAIVAIVANGAIVAYLPWGANDAAAVSLVLLGALVAPRRPLASGALIGLGIALKVILVVALVPLAALWLVHDRGRAARTLGSTFGLLFVTSAPYFIVAPGPFVEDTIRFNLGRTDLAYPASGLGLGALYPDLVDGAVMLGLAAVLVLGASALAVWWVRRTPRVEVALFCAGLIVLAGLIPARSFQISYAPLLVVLAGPIWRLRREEWDPRWPSTTTRPTT